MQNNASKFKDLKNNLIYKKKQQEKIRLNHNISRLRKDNK